MPNDTSLLQQQPAPTPKPSIVDDLFDLTAATNLNELLGRALRMTIRITGAEAGSVFFMASPPRSIQAGAFRQGALAHIQRLENQIGQRLKKSTLRTRNASVQIVSLAKIPGSQLTLVNAPLLHKYRVMGTMSFVLPPNQPLAEVQKNLLNRLVRGIGHIAVTIMELDLAHRQLQRIGVFYDIGQALVTTFDINKLLVNTMEFATKLTDAGAASILLVDEEQRELVFRVSHGVRSELLRRHRIPMGEGIAGWVAHTGRPVIANDARSDTRFSHRVDVRTGFLTQSIGAVPLKIKGRVIGVLEVLNKYSGDGFTQDDIQLLSFIGTQAAIAIENARLYHRLREERDQVISRQETIHRDIASGLHEGTMQYLSAISLSLDNLKLLNTNNNPEVLQHQLLALEKLVNHATRNTRTLLFDLRPPILETHGLFAACKFYVEQLTSISSFKIHFRAGNQVRLSTKQSVAIFSVIQEAANNITTHADAENAWILLEIEDQRLNVTVRDDGHGFNLAAVENTQNDDKTPGLDKMKRLTAAIDADLRIESSTQSPHRGTTVQLIVPLN